MSLKIAALCLAGMLGALAAGGCSAPTGEGEPTQEPDLSAPSTPPRVGPPPTDPSRTATPTGEEADLQTYLDGLAEMHSQTDPPQVDVIRRVRPQEQVALVADCMTERGWAVKVEADGGIVASVPNEQASALDESWYICSASYPPMQQYLRPLNKAELERLYAYYVDDLTPCLRQEGYAIDPPSREQWLVKATADEDYWVPYADIDGTIAPDLAQRCPLDPGDELIYGDR